MYNLIWNIHKEVDPNNSTINNYRAEFNKEQSNPLFHGIWPKEHTFKYEDIEVLDEDDEMLWVEEELINISANYLGPKDHYNKLIDNTNIKFNYINDEQNL